MQECIDFFNNLEGVNNEEQETKLGDVLLQSRDDWRDVLLLLEDDEQEIYTAAIQEYLIDFTKNGQE